ncbi:uncharacterized protein [Lolium perenne]|uniref:uncharacterized protein isoform X2 n=1 Tax=Lolium perenne TaxID=4522 RepID=UPI0021F51090|nr:uncharacterized protein LOC127298503 isoform X2 [Lolium perenne]
MGGIRRERRAAVAAASASAEESLRRSCEEVLRLNEEGNTAGASGLALKLVDQHPKSAAPCNLVGYLMESATSKVRYQLEQQDSVRARSGQHADADPDPARIAEERARADEREVAISHMAACQEGCVAWYRRASQLAPRCPYTRANCARVLGMSDHTAEAYKEFSAAVHIRNPEVPDRNNPWMHSTDVMTDEEKKLSAIAMAQDEFNCFLHLSDTRVYTACRDLLYNLRQGTPGVKARNEARDLAAKYPFSARANLLLPYLMRSFIGTSSSTIPKVQQYKQVLREVAQIVDTFPSSIVISLFRAEVLFAMERYLDASVECLRGLTITRPDDPVSQVIPPDSASGSGRTERTQVVLEKLIDLLEKSEEKVVDAEEIEKLQQALCLRPEDPELKCLVKGLVDDLNKSLSEDLNLKLKHGEPVPREQKCTSSKKQPIKVLGKTPENKNIAEKSTSSKKQPINVLEENAEKGKGDKGKSAITIPQSVLYSNKYQKFTKKKTEEAVSPLQIMGKRIVPRETVDVYADYCYLRSTCSVKKDICHLCVFEAHKYYKNDFFKGNMILHCQTKHETRTMKCDVPECDVRLRTEEEKEVHYHYCHAIHKDWWKHW